MRNNTEGKKNGEEEREISASRNREKKTRDSIFIDTTHIVKCANYL
jgi:hypothetical protein